jgi:hypothetical protein
MMLVPAPPVSSHPLADQLVAHRTDVGVDGGRFSGPGAAVIASAARGARFVVLGEDHGVVEIAGVASALYGLVQPEGFDSIALEVGPYAAARLADVVRAPSPRDTLRAFLHAYPLSLPIYGWAEDFALLEEAARRAGSRLRLFGLDQEFMGAAGLLLDTALARAPAGQARALITAARERAADRYMHARETGDPRDLFLISAARDELVALCDAGRAAGLDTVAPLEALLESRDIYAAHETDGVAAGAARAAIMRRNLAAAMAHGGNLFIKVGAYHAFRGTTPLGLEDVGSLVAQRSQEVGAPSLHMMVVGIRGAQSAFVQVGVPMAAQAFDLCGEDSPLPGLAPLIRIASEQAGWSLFDLRPLRASVAAQGAGSQRAAAGVQDGVVQVIEGYDLVLLIPEATASMEL